VLSILRYQGIASLDFPQLFKKASDGPKWLSHDLGLHPVRTTIVSSLPVDDIEVVAADIGADEAALVVPA